jgi:hypothetical protein
MNSATNVTGIRIPKTELVGMSSVKGPSSSLTKSELYVLNISGSYVLL